MRPAEADSVSALASLTGDEALQRLQLIGPNTLPQPRAMPLWRRIHAIRDPLVLLLLVAVTLTMATGDAADTIVIALVIVVNTTLAVRQEISADHAVSALGALMAPVARVLRDGQQVSRPVAELVPGDLVVLAEGDLVPADSVLVGGASLQVRRVCPDRGVAKDDDEYRSARTCAHHQPGCPERTIQGQRREKQVRRYPKNGRLIARLGTASNGEVAVQVEVSAVDPDRSTEPHGTLTRPCRRRGTP